MKTISIELSEKSISDAIRKIEEYKRSLNDKLVEFVEKLASVGINVIHLNVYTEGDSDPEHQAYVIATSSVANTAEATLYFKGPRIAFIEFGAGIHYNGSVGSAAYEKAADMRMTIGSYGEGHGAEDSWVYFDEDTGRWKTSHGTQASMPMYKADMEIQSQVRSIAKEVFGG